MNVKVGVEQAGRFKTMVSGGRRGTIEYPWQKNLILDAGIYRILSNNTSGVLNHISVGAGSTAPSVGQTQLASKIAHTNRNRTLSHGYDFGGEFGWTKLQVQFAQGAAAGNISELGVGWDGTNLFSRALVLNSEGNPTTITVLPDEFLTVIYELRSWYVVPDSHDITYDYDGESKTTTVTYFYPPNLGNPLNGFGSAMTERAPDNSTLLYHMTYGEVSGNTASFTLKYDINTANSGITSVHGRNNSSYNKILPFGFNGTFCTFTPPIPKTNEFEVTITGTLTMSRRA